MKQFFILFAVASMFAYVEAAPQNVFNAKNYSNLGEQKTDIQADGATYDFDSAWSTLTGNVAIKHGTIELRADKIRYNSESGDAEAYGNVSFFNTADNMVWKGEELKVNVFTSSAVSSSFDFYTKPYRVMAERGTVANGKNGAKEYRLDNATMTTCTNEVGKFHFHVTADKLFVRTDDELVVKGAVPHLFGVPFFYWPYYWKDLNRHYGFRFEPGYSKSWGPFLLSAYKTPLYRDVDNKVYVDAKTSVDLRAERGVAFGEKVTWQGGDNWDGWLSGYYLSDEDLPVDVEDKERYRVRLNHRWNITPSDQVLVQGLYVSDDRFMEDFFEEEFDEMNQPDNYLSYTHIGDGYSAGVITRMRLNDFYNQVERLPELYLSINAVELGNSSIYYEGNGSVSFLRRLYDERRFAGQEVPEYDAFRADKEFMFSMPMKLFGFLSVVPRAGYRFTYYSKTRETRVEEEQVVNEETGEVTTKEKQVAVDGDAGIRNVFELGLKTSFKAYSTWQDNNGFTWRHIVEPYMDYVFIPEPNYLVEELYQFDSIDEIKETNGVKIGVRNRWQYKANIPEARVRELLYIDLYGFFNFNAEGDEDTFESLNWDVRYRPVSWLRFTTDGEYTQKTSEVTDAIFRMALQYDVFEASLMYRYLVDESSLVSGKLTWNINREWAISLYGRYEYEESHVEEIGAWLQRKYDCIAYRIYLSFEPGYTHANGTEEDDDIKISAVMWLTDFEPDNLRELDDR